MLCREFNDLVNMTAPELEEWLKDEESTGSGLSKDDGSGETVGHESGRKIIKVRLRPDLFVGAALECAFALSCSSLGLPIHCMRSLDIFASWCTIPYSVSYFSVNVWPESGESHADGSHS